MIIREILDSDRDAWVRLRDALWPGSLSDHDEETRKYFAHRSTAMIVFVAELDGRIVRFLELNSGVPASVMRPRAWIESPRLRVSAAHFGPAKAGHYD